MQENLRGAKIRADVDDTGDRLNKKIRKAEKEWIPYIIVVGRNEKEGDTITVRRRSDGKQVEMRLEDLVREIRSQTEGGFPYRARPPAASPVEEAEVQGGLSSLIFRILSFSTPFSFVTRNEYVSGSKSS